MKKVLLWVYLLVGSQIGVILGQDLFPDMPISFLQTKNVKKITEMYSIPNNKGISQISEISTEYVFKQGILSERNTFFEKALSSKEVYTFLGKQLSQIDWYKVSLEENNPLAKNNPAGTIAAGLAPTANRFENMSQVGTVKYAYQNDGKVKQVDIKLNDQFCVRRCTERFSAFTKEEFDMQLARGTQSNPRHVYDCSKKSEQRQIKYQYTADSTTANYYVDGVWSGKQTNFIKNGKIAGQTVHNHKNEITQKVGFQYNSSGQLITRDINLIGCNGFDILDFPITNFNKVEYFYDSQGRVIEERRTLDGDLKYAIKYVYE